MQRPEPSAFATMERPKLRTEGAAGVTVSSAPLRGNSASFQTFIGVAPDVAESIGLSVGRPHVHLAVAETKEAAFVWLWGGADGTHKATQLGKGRKGQSGRLAGRRLTIRLGVGLDLGARIRRRAAEFERDMLPPALAAGREGTPALLVRIPWPAGGAPASPPSRQEPDEDDGDRQQEAASPARPPAARPRPAPNRPAPHPGGRAGDVTARVLGDPPPGRSALDKARKG